MHTFIILLVPPPVTPEELAKLNQSATKQHNDMMEKITYIHKNIVKHGYYKIADSSITLATLDQWDWKILNYSKNNVVYDNYAKDYIKKINVIRTQLEKEREWRKVAELNHPWFLENNDFCCEYFYILSSFAITKGAFYYEVELPNATASSGITVGWTTRMADIFYGLNNNEQTLVWEKKNNLKSGDIIGCLVDVEEKLAKFYLNGKQTKRNVVDDTKDFFDCTPIFAVASIPFKQQIIFNFGHKPFQRKPRQPHSSLLNNEWSVEIKENVYPYWLREYSWSDSPVSRMFYLFEFTQKQNKNSIMIPSVCFRDSIQTKFDNIVYKLEKFIKEEVDCKLVINNIIANMPNKKMDNKIVRLFQSIIELISFSENETKRNQTFICVSAIFDNFFNQPKILLYENNWHSILMHYFTYLQENVEFCKIKCINLCYFVIYLNINKIKQNFNCNGCNILQEKLTSFLCNIFLQSNDYNIKLYSFIALKKLSVNNQVYPLLLTLSTIDCVKEKIQNLIKLLNSVVEKTELEKINKENPNTALLQLYLCNFSETQESFHQFIKEQMETDKKINLAKTIETEESFIQMNPEDKNIGVELSPSNMMVRNDEKGLKTIRSKFPINAGLFYFEVTLLTSGPMRIGFAAQLMSINAAVGDNILSIGIDGHHRCVWMGDKAYPFKNLSFHRWSVGDVVGALFDSHSKKIIFGINTKIIELDVDPFEEIKTESQKTNAEVVDKIKLDRRSIFSLPCHVAVSLEMLQQCSFEFTRPAPLKFLHKLGRLADSNAWTGGNVYKNSVVLFNSVNEMGNFNGVCK